MFIFNQLKKENEKKSICPPKKIYIRLEDAIFILYFATINFKLFIEC